MPAYYVFPPNTPTAAKRLAFEKAFEHNELPLDVDTISSIEKLTDKDKYTMLKSNLRTFKLVLFDVAKTSVYSDLANKLISDYMNSNMLTAGFEMRDL